TDSQPVLVDLGAPVTLGQVLNDAEREHEIEHAVAPGQRARLLVGEPSYFGDRLEPELFALGAHDFDERRIGVEGVNLGHLRPLGQPLRDVAERAADLEHAEPVAALLGEPAEERTQKVIAARPLVVEVWWRPAGALAVDQHLDDARAVTRDVLAAVDAQNAPVAQIAQLERLAHPATSPTSPIPRATAAARSCRSPTRARAAAPRPAASAAPPITRTMRSASSSGRRASNSSPVTPSSISERLPSHDDATHASPALIASSRALGWLSVNDASTKASASR